MPIVDIHPHVIATDNVRYPLQPLGGNQSTWSRDRPTPYDKMVEEMDQAGVAKSAIVQASTAYGYDNSYVAEAIAAHPRRFTGVFSVDMLAADNVEKMKHWLARGFSGMRLFTTGSTMPGQATWFDDPRTMPAWQHANEIGMPVCMQLTPQGFPQLRGLIEKFPKVKFILDHLARPHLVDGPPFAADQEFLGLSRYPECLSEADAPQRRAQGLGQGDAGNILRALMKAYGANRIAWGSNFPATEGTLKEILGKAQQAWSFASAADREWVFGKTALTLYPSLKD